MGTVGHRAAASIAGLPDFLIYLGTSACLVALFVVLYTLVTPQRELALIRAGNTAAAISLGGAILGFAIPLSMSIAQSHDLLDMVIWSCVALIVQLGVFYVSGLLIDRSSQRITDGDVAAGSFLAFASIAAGLVNAACMSYPAP
jgi:putative membrane protein